MLLASTLFLIYKLRLNILFNRPTNVHEDNASNAVKCSNPIGTGISEKLINKNFNNLVSCVISVYETIASVNYSLEMVAFVFGSVEPCISILQFEMG